MVVIYVFELLLGSFTRALVRSRSPKEFLVGFCHCFICSLVSLFIAWPFNLVALAASLRSCACIPFIYLSIYLSILCVCFRIKKPNNYQALKTQTERNQNNDNHQKYDTFQMDGWLGECVCVIIVSLCVRYFVLSCFFRYSLSYFIYVCMFKTLLCSSWAFIFYFISFLWCVMWSIHLKRNNTTQQNAEWTPRKKAALNKTKRRAHALTFISYNIHIDSIL